MAAAGSGKGWAAGRAQGMAQGGTGAAAAAAAAAVVAAAGGGRAAAGHRAGAQEPGAVAGRALAWGQRGRELHRRATQQLTVGLVNVLSSFEKPACARHNQMHPTGRTEGEKKARPAVNTWERRQAKAARAR